MSIKPVLVPDHTADDLRRLMDSFAEASTGPVKKQLNESQLAELALGQSGGGNDDDGNDRYDHSGYGMQNPVANKIARLLKQRQPVFYEFVTGGEPAQIRSISRAGGEVERDPETGSLLGPVVFDIARKTSGGRAYLDQVTITPRDGFSLVAVGNKQVARRTGNPDAGMPDSVKQMRDTFDEGVAEGFRLRGTGNPGMPTPYDQGQADAKKGRPYDNPYDQPGEEQEHRNYRKGYEQGKRQGVAEGSLEEYGDTAKGQKMLGKVHNRAADQVTSKKADKDPAYARKAQQTQDRAWDRLAVKEQDVEEGSEDKIRVKDGDNQYYIIPRSMEKEFYADWSKQFSTNIASSLWYQWTREFNEKYFKYRAKPPVNEQGVAEGSLNEFTGSYNGGDDDDGNDRYDHSGYGMQNPVANKIARLLKQRQPVFYEFVTGGEPAQIRSISRAGGEVERDPETGSLLGPVVFDIARKTSGGRAYLDQVTITPRDGFSLVAVGNKQVARRTGNPDVGMPDSVKQMRDTFDEGVAEGMLTHRDFEKPDDVDVQKMAKLAARGLLTYAAKTKMNPANLLKKDYYALAAMLEKTNPQLYAAIDDQLSDNDYNWLYFKAAALAANAAAKPGVAEGIMDVVKQAFNDAVVGHPMGTSDEQFIKSWADDIRDRTGRDIPAEKLARLYQDYTRRSPDVMQSHGTTNEESGVAEAGKPDVMRHKGDKTVKIVKRGGKPIGEIGIDAGPGGNGDYYVKLYDGSYDAAGFDTAEEALAELRYAIKSSMLEGSDNLAIGQQMARDGIEYDPAREGEIISQIGDYLKRSGMTPRQIRGYMIDNDFVSDQLSYLPRKSGVTEAAAENNPVVNAITRRIMLQRTDLLSKYGPEKVGAAIDEVADFVGDVEEIGSSDVSGWVRHVEQMLGNMEQDVAEAAPQLQPRQTVWAKNTRGHWIEYEVSRVRPDGRVAVMGPGGIDIFPAELLVTQRPTGAVAESIDPVEQLRADIQRFAR